VFSTFFLHLLFKQLLQFPQSAKTEAIFNIIKEIRFKLPSEVQLGVCITARCVISLHLIDTLRINYCFETDIRMGGSTQTAGPKFYYLRMFLFEWRTNENGKKIHFKYHQRAKSSNSTLNSTQVLSTIASYVVILRQNTSVYA